MAVEPRSCGECSLCCKLMHVPWLDKPADRWCAHAVTRRGCGIYATRPPECGVFECAWLADGTLDEAWKPVRSKFLMYLEHGGRRLIVHNDPGHAHAWRRAPFYAQIKAWSAREGGLGAQVLVRSGVQTLIVFPEADLPFGPMELGDSVESGYAEPGRPFVRLKKADGSAVVVTA